MASAAPFANLSHAPVATMSTPLIRVCAVNGTNVALSAAHVTLSNAVPLLGEDDDAASLGGLVGEGAQLRRVREAFVGAPRRREKGRRLTISERDRPGLVQEQNIHVARRLHPRARSSR